MLMVIRPEGKIERLDESKPSLQRLQELVGGYLEVVQSPQLPGKWVVLNEDGDPLDLPLNEAATIATGWPHMLRGTVVICNHDDIN